jgi:mannose-6-phosphate isomerase-like protein (cupin superfamily)
MTPLVNALAFAALLLQPQALTTSPTPPNAKVLFWPHGVPAQGIDHKDIFANHGMQISHRDKSGNVEVHLTKTDVMVIQTGEATLLYGGEGQGMHSTGPDELQGTTIKGGASRRVVPGDIIHIPTGVPHQFILAPGETITYFIVKVVDPPAK